MGFSVFLAVLFSAFFQAGWNFLAKRSRADKISLLTVGWFLFGLAALPFTFLTFDWRAFSGEWLAFIALSGAIHAIYVCLLGWGYTIGEISVVYPVARGLGIVGTTLGALTLGLHGISGAGALGIASVVLGTLLIGLREVPRRDRRTAFLAAIAIAATVSAYTLLDSEGVKRVPVALYLVSSLLIAPVLASPLLLASRRAQVAQVFRSYKAEALVVAAAGALAYGIILWAYQRTAAAYVAALREFSVVIAAGLGIAFLRENLYRRKIAALFMILIGVLLIKAA